MLYNRDNNNLFNFLGNNLLKQKIDQTDSKYNFVSELTQQFV